MRALRCLVRVVGPRPEAVDERDHAKRFKLQDVRAIPSRFRQRIVKQRADILVPAVP